MKVNVNPKGVLRKGENENWLRKAKKAKTTSTEDKLDSKTKGVQIEENNGHIGPTTPEKVCQNERREQEPIAGWPAPAFRLGVQ
jgi:hypothetical protein